MCCFATDGRKTLELDTFSLREGEKLVVVGPNGAGKSTLLRALAGQARGAKTLELSVRGVPFSNSAETRAAFARVVAYLPQRTEVPVDFTVREVLEMGRAPHRGPWHAMSPEDRAAVDSALARWDLRSLEHRRADTLSGGELQRVHLARILAQHTSIILLDEPAAALDLRQAHHLYETLDREVSARRIAYVIVTHDLAMARRHADRVMVLDRGVLAAEGTPTEALSAHVLRQVFGVAP
jgi:iron complex transport system ATP-binding protein